MYHLKIQYNAFFINKKNKIILMYHSKVHTLRSVEERKNTGDIPAPLTQNEYRIIPDWYYL